MGQKLLSKRRLFYSIPIQEKWREQLSGQKDHIASIWAVLMLQALPEEEG